MRVAHYVGQSDMNTPELDFVNRLDDLTPERGCFFCHPDWSFVRRTGPFTDIEESRKWYAMEAVKFIQKDLRHYIGKTGCYRIGNQEVPIIPCDDGGWVRLDVLLELDVVWCHRNRRLDCQPLSRNNAYQRRRQICCRLQLLYEGNILNHIRYDRVRLQFLGIRLAQPNNQGAIEHDVQPFDHRMVSLAVQRHELRMSHGTSSLRDEDIELSDG